MFIPDLMHKFELGVWKAIFTHLLRILYAVSEDAIQKFDMQFHKVPTFGRDTIRRFSNNVSAMKKLAARDFEDILQCCILVFEGLIPSKKYNNIVMDLLFELTAWHAYAKLHLHTEHTLQVFERATATLGAAICHFRKTDAMDFDDDPEEPLDDTRLDFADKEPLLRTSPKVHYHMSKSQHFCEDIISFVIRNKGDPAFKMFMPSLKDHLLTRLTGRAYNGDEDTFTHKEHNQILFLDNKLYRHKVLRINYTMYDMRHAQDSINPRTHPDVMVLSHEDGEDADQHPYWYTRVVGVFHVNVCYRGPLPISRQPQHMDFLWVRWFGRDLTAPGGFKTRRLHRVGFVDRDMFMRYLGGGVGHKGTGITLPTVGDEMDIDDDESDDDKSDDDESDDDKQSVDCLVQDEDEGQIGQEEDDYSYRDSDDDEDEQGTGGEGSDHEEVEELGPEDGEDGEEDEYGDEGYAPL
ncbi:hypothetical protein SCP_1302770 [Sparassis crispa]|uniref:Uncharacterized protein n=1 Tax=Sparassis crispa TaxID=139825 RepID=A0A401H246_9APHY|nr:hypothetical protein SCP_1302770 [Sparassis crispa]GBE88462.1 hypothetical protein SCP_1302770 [Sparassis crispa]